MNETNYTFYQPGGPLATVSFDVPLGKNADIWRPSGVETRPLTFWLSELIETFTYTLA